MTPIRAFLIAATVAALTGCVSKLVAYQPSQKVSFKEGANIVAGLTMKQPHNVRPNKFEMYDDHIYWHYGYYTEHYPGGSKTRDAYLKAPFDAIRDVKIFLKRGWYSVYLYFNDDSNDAVYYTKDIDEVKRYADAFESLRLEYKKIPIGQDQPVDTATNSTSQKLRDLQALKNEGIITDSEYQQKRKQLLDGF